MHKKHIYNVKTSQTRSDFITFIVLIFKMCDGVPSPIWYSVFGTAELSRVLLY